MLFSLKNRIAALRCSATGHGHNYRYGASSTRGTVKRCLYCKNEIPVKTAPRDLVLH